jgi:hypothetical protein
LKISNCTRVVATSLLGRADRGRFGRFVPGGHA